jgi:hypothetical protein
MPTALQWHGRVVDLQSDPTRFVYCLLITYLQSKSLELVWRGAKSYGTCADVWTHNYMTGNYGGYCSVECFHKPPGQDLVRFTFKRDSSPVSLQHMSSRLQ